MKISEFTTEHAIDVFCELTPFVINIFSDDELLGELRTAVDFGEARTMAEKLAITASKFSKIIPVILKKRKDDVFGILGVLNEKTPEDIAKQNIIKTMAQIKEISKDKELLDFFKSCTSTEGGE